MEFLLIEYCGEESQTINYSYKDDDTPQAITLNNATYYYLTDGHGDVREITNKEGSTLVKYSYDAFGSIANVTPVKTGVQETDELAKQLSTVNPYTYASYRYDSDTGLYYLRARYYDSITGRFLSKDPVVHENLYPYAGNNPINAIDTSGMRLSLLQQGSKGNQVYILQDTLRFLYKKYRKGALNLVRDGDFGPKTKAGVKKFQEIAFPGQKKEHDGKVGPKTWNKLLRRGSSPCRDYNGYRDGSLVDTLSKRNWVGSDCFYSINWIRNLRHNLTSQCELAEYNVALNNARSSNTIKGLIARTFYYKKPTISQRLCIYGSSHKQYSTICSEFLPMKKILSWRRRNLSIRATVNELSYLPSISYPLVRYSAWAGNI